MSEERGDIATRFQKGNQFWKLRPKSGRKPIWEDPEDMRAACEEYFDYVENTPLWESNVISFQGQGYDHPLSKMRAMTLDGLCVFLGIARRSWANYKDKPDFLPVVEYVESVMHDYKLSGAAAGLLNANIIARELGLKDTSDVNVGGQDGNPVKHEIRFVPVGAKKDAD